ncbi:P-loop containing nucleoside triphosphate hydrolase [Sesbania bispinosa]|nr:P-loop containing nucleoside triphosphate hydrolase [Sesbania bispinosa]
MAEAFLSASVKVLLDKIISREFVNFFRSQKLDVSLLEKLKTTLLSLQAVLNDAEEKQMTDPYVKEWLDKLRDIVAEADNLLDEINTEALRCKVEAEYQSQTVSAKVRNFLSSRFNRFNREINSKLQIQFERLEHLRKQKLGLKGGSSSVWHGTPTSSVVDESGIYGRDGDRRTIRDYLLSEDANHSGSKIGVISIVGMGGIGKTTLAKLLYNDPVVKEEFNLKAWAHISKDFDLCSVTKTLLESVTSDTNGANTPSPLHLESVTSKRIDIGDLNTLQVQLKQSLSHKKILLVLDDIWDGSYVDWNNLKDIFNAGEVGSKLIITTRDERVALAMQTFLPIHYLTPLQSEDCWSLLAKHAFGASNCQQRFSLEVIGKEIVKKCDGLPLAAVALRGHLGQRFSAGEANFEMHDLINDLAAMVSFAYCIRLPSVTCNLYNLQTLLLSGCWRLTELPEDMGKLVNLRHLDVSGTHLQEMPMQIAKLQNLQTLSDFVVSKQHDGLMIAELRNFLHLQGKLSISKLQNITNSYDAFQANLKMKEQIDELELKWDWYGAITEGSQIQTLVVEQLQPSTNMKKLTINGYGGTSFPNWLGDSSFGNMVSLCIGGCHHCPSLPPLGQLHSLKELIISGMISVKIVGTEFYGSISPSFQSFPSLETLKFSSMPEWETWNLIGGTTTEFPSLRYLSLKNCPKLKGNIPSNLPHLSKLKLFQCGLLESGDSNDNSNNIRPSDLFNQLMLPFNSLKELTIFGFPSLTSFPRDGLSKTLRSLTIDSCENLDFLPPESFQSYKSLEDLRISNSCNSMTSFTLGSLPVLKSFHFYHCKNLKWIFIVEEGSQCLSFLQSIKIWGCHELESFSPGRLPTPNLIHFHVSSCNKLHSLPQLINTLTGLQKLEIHGLPNLQSFAKEGLPINLRKLDVGNHGGNTAITKWSLERLTCLSVLEIRGDDIVNALMKMKVAMPLLPISLVTLCIADLNDIKSLDGKWLQHLTSLQNLEISRSPNLTLLPEEGLPPSLSVLSIQNCPLLKASCQRKRGKEWPKIAQIPCIIIRDQMSVHVSY